MFLRSLVLFSALLSPFFSFLVYTQEQVSAEEVFLSAQHLYDQGEYKKAAKTLKSLVKDTQDVSKYYHLLGKAYGRMAENAVWIRAIGLAKRTRKNFELAVELDPCNFSAQMDLLKYYMRAPRFLGGGRKKAQALVAHIETLDAEQAKIARQMLKDTK